MEYQAFQERARFELARRVAILGQDVSAWTTPVRTTDMGLSAAQRTALVAMTDVLKERQQSAFDAVDKPALPRSVLLTSSIPACTVAPSPTLMRFVLQCALALLLMGRPGFVAGQEREGRPAGTVAGRVTRSDDSTGLPTVSITVVETGQSTASGSTGRYILRQIPAGQQKILYRWVGYRSIEVAVEITPGDTTRVDVALEPASLTLGDIVVFGASRGPERIVDAPAAITVIEPRVLASRTLTAQPPLVLQSVPGVDVVQSGVNDFNVNARGFNSSLNRRVLVLQDGRDLAIPFLGGAQEWNTMAVPLEDVSKVEMVRGPGSALYGANAFSGVVSITTPTAREVQGTKLTVGGGELETVRGDLRHAGLAAGGRLGYRINVGYSQSDTWTRSRTRFDGTSLQREYAPVTDQPVAAGREVRPLLGQTIDSVTGEAIGDRANLRNIYGSARIDLYATNGSVLSVDGGAAQVENEVLITGVGRLQIPKLTRPFARVEWAAPRFNVFAYWTRRATNGPEFSLTSGSRVEDRSDILHLEAQRNHGFLGGRGRLVYGASYRSVWQNTLGTLMGPADDARRDDIYSGYALVDYDILPQLRLAAAARFDDGDLFDAQFSPKGAVLFRPHRDHSIYFSVSRAFQPPNYAELFVRLPAGLPANFGPLEAGLRASPLGPALTDVPQGQLFGGGGGTSSAVPALALGNRNLNVERIVAWQLGYKAALSSRAYATVDLFFNNIKDFVTDLLPGANPTYGPWTAPAEVPEAFRATLEQTVRSGLTAAGRASAAAGLTRVNGQTAIVLSYTNAGRARDYGVEVGAGYQLTRDLRADGWFSASGFEVESAAPGDALLPNAPNKKGQITASYAGGPLDLSASLRLVEGYQWAAGVFQGFVPASQTVNLSGGYRVSPNLRLHATAINLLDQKRFQLYGGSVIGRRVLAGVTAVF
jgi:outer membrane receptor protein involved in Fe transport